MVELIMSEREYARTETEAFERLAALLLTSTSSPCAPAGLQEARERTSTIVHEIRLKFDGLEALERLLNLAAIDGWVRATALTEVMAIVDKEPVAATPPSGLRV